MVKKREVDKKVNKVLEILDALIKRNVIKSLTGIDGSIIRNYLKEVKNPTGKYKPNTIAKKLFILKESFEELGYRYKELAKDLEYIIMYLKEKAKKDG